jgi:DNA-binding XRE family transcriptional regulator
MKINNDWLWDKSISPKKAISILRNTKDEHFLSLASLLLSRKNTPKEVFKVYLKPTVFLQNWQRIKRQMRKDSWNNPRIEFWQAIYEKLKEKYEDRGIVFARQGGSARQENEFCKATAAQIILIRKQKSLTQKDLAKKLKISQQMVSRIEKGKENISLLTLKKIADSLGVAIHLELK